MANLLSTPLVTAGAVAAAILAACGLILACWAPISALLDKLRGRRRQVPHVAGYPVLGVLPHIAKDASGFIAETARRHGDIFTGDLLGHRVVFMANAEHFGAVWRNSRELSFQAITDGIVANLLDAKREAVAGSNDRHIHE